jgi:hypothetical protein
MDRRTAVKNVITGMFPATIANNLAKVDVIENVPQPLCAVLTIDPMAYEDCDLNVDVDSIQREWAQAFNGKPPMPLIVMLGPPTSTLRVVSAVPEPFDKGK